ncbi:MAG: hypothetical protein JRI91_12960 [Deltaproteobacteria bacterium]|nr:hypothetical protein [Deltaproteobacteria bacterium]
MQAKNIKNKKKSIRELDKQIEKLTDKLLLFDQLARGSVATIKTKCGVKVCRRCLSGKMHPHTRISWTENGKGYTRKIPEDEIEWFKSTSQKYREFKVIRRDLKKLELKKKKMVDSLENLLLIETRKLKPFLWTKK